MEFVMEELREICLVFGLERYDIVYCCSCFYVFKYLYIWFFFLVLDNLKINWAGFYDI